VPHDVSLIAIVAVGFVVAAIFGYGANRIGLPALVGYLLAGVFIGPFTPGFVADPAMAGQLAEMGVILLMFGVGLHFSASDLLAVRGLAVPGAIARIVVATLMGAWLCTLWGWTFGEGIVFGLSISVASTVVVLKALEERNLVQSPVGRVAIGWLIVEDLVMVLALVLLPAFAETLGGDGADLSHSSTSSQSLAWELGLTLLKLVAFVALAATIGPKVIPRILMTFARTGSRELFTLSVLGIAVGIAFGSAAAFGVSFALGAFFAGVIMGESELSHRAADNSLPLQDAFSVLFFVSIGMLFDPTILVREPLMVLGTVALIIVGKAAITFAIVLLLRYPISMALGLSASLAQIGEFSFILAGLGVTLGLMTAEGQDLILAGAILSITLNPLAFGAARKLHDRLRKPRWVRAMQFGAARQEKLVAELDRINALAEEKERQQEQRITMFLATFPLFSSIDKAAQEELLLLFVPRTAAPGERVVRAGDIGDAMYFIVSGAVEVLVDGPPIHLEAGSYFGEMALLSGGRRIADVAAVDFCQLLVLARRDFNQFMARHPELRAELNAMAERRIAMNLAQRAGAVPETQDE